MEITINVVREKIRKKMLYITVVLGIMVVALFSSDVGSITVGGRNIKDYDILLPILMNVVNFLAGAVALALSVTTIPDEYERRTSHLIWSRGISQSRYHFSLAAGNVLVSWISGFILYFTLGVFAVVCGYGQLLGQIAESVIFMMLYTTILCLLATALSIKVSVVFTATIMILVLLAGAFRSLLILLAAALTGAGGWVLKRLLLLIPNLAGLSEQAGNLVQGKNLNSHVIIMGLFIIWLEGLLILVLKREEA